MRFDLISDCRELEVYDDGWSISHQRTLRPRNRPQSSTLRMVAWPVKLCKEEATPPGSHPVAFLRALREGPRGPCCLFDLPSSLVLAAPLGGWSWLRGYARVLFHIHSETTSQHPISTTSRRDSSTSSQYTEQ
jgi:hypothetical protein